MTDSLKQRCTSLNNYSTSRSILAALDSSTIARLHQTWAVSAQLCLFFHYSFFCAALTIFCRVYHRNPRRNLSRFGSLQITVGITMSTVQDFEIPRRLQFPFLVRLFGTDDIYLYFGLIEINRFVFDRCDVLPRG